ncbi:MAG TPA: hypothetical protein VF121_10830 [Thermoanaerobaculia bacterium]|nr:hypothetical protein [Thermoanaerobaculia bacterium]
MRRPTAIALLALAAALAAGGCGKEDSSTPVACLEGSDAYLQALAAAPGAVRLGGETPISECLPERQEGGELATVGEGMVEAATMLNAEARAEPGGEASVQLGYLIGAVILATEETEGIHADLLRRLRVAARYAPGRKPLPPAFLAAYGRGFEAGREHG